MQPHNFKGRPFDADCPEDGTVFVRAEDAEAAIDAEIADSSAQSDRLLAVIDAHEKRIAELEAAIDKLAAGKGRYHTEANYMALIAVRNKNLHK